MGDMFKSLSDRFMAWVNANPRRARTIGGVLLLLILSIVINSYILPVPPPHVVLHGEPIRSGGWFTNALLTTLIVDLLLLAAAFFATRNIQLVPSGLQNLMEAVIEYLYNLAESVAGKAAATYFPWAATIFLFVLLSNYSGLIPGVGSIGFFQPSDKAHANEIRLAGQLAMADGKLILQQDATPTPEGEHAEATPAAEGDHAAAEGEHAAAEGEHGAAEGGHYMKFVPLFRAPSADLNTTFALALATMVMVQVNGVRALGGKYFHKFWNTSGQGFMKGINIFVSILEAISEASRILSFAFRLFGNIFAGEVVLATMAFLVMFLVPVPFYALEVLVGAVQALVFAMLSLVFFSMSTISHEHSDDHH